MLSGIIFREESISGIPGPDFWHFRSENDPSSWRNENSKMEAEIVAETLQKPEVDKNKSLHATKKNRKLSNGQGFGMNTGMNLEKKA